MIKEKIYTFKATLEESKPKVWRKFEIKGSLPITQLTYAVMIMFEMHPEYPFLLNQESFNPEIDLTPNNMTNTNNIKKDIIMYDLFDSDLPTDESALILNPRKVLIEDALDKVKKDIALLFDPEIEWVVNIKVASVKEVSITDDHFPKVLEGEGYGIIDNDYKLQSLKRDLIYDKSSMKDVDEYLLNRYGINLNSFDQIDVNFRLLILPTINENIYEQDKIPTVKEYALIKRVNLNDVSEKIIVDDEFDDLSNFN